MRLQRLFLALFSLARRAVGQIGRLLITAAGVLLSVIGAAFWLSSNISAADRSIIINTAEASGGIVLVASGWRRAWWLWRVYPGTRQDLGRHEAGHALVGRALGLPYRGIFLEESIGGHSGLAVISHVPGDKSYSPLDLAARLIVALEAGKAAERGRRLNGPYQNNVTDDQGKARELDLLLQLCGAEAIRDLVVARLPGLLRSPIWRGAIDEVAAIAVEDGEVSQARLDELVARHQLQDSAESWFASLGRHPSSWVRLIKGRPPAARARWGGASPPEDCASAPWRTGQ